MSLSASLSATTILPVEIDIDINNELHRLAKEQNRTPHALIMTAIKQFLQQQPNNIAQQQFHQSAVESLQHLQNTGLHATHDEVKAWVSNYKSGKKGTLSWHE